METKIIDNFLNQEELDTVKSNLVSTDFPLYCIGDVSGVEESLNMRKENWNFYLSHLFFNGDDIKSNYYRDVYKMFIPKIKEIYPFKALMRIKLNFYPYNDTLREHPVHVDTHYSHYGALFSLNTCDGFTRLHDGTKVDSIENRMLFFDPSLPHNSSNTTNDYGRSNINFNFV